MYVCMHVCLYATKYVSKWYVAVCMYTRMYVCMYACVLICDQICIEMIRSPKHSTFQRISESSNMYFESMDAHASVCENARVCYFACRCVHACMHVCMWRCTSEKQFHIDQRVKIQMCICICKCGIIHTYLYTYTHTHKSNIKKHTWTCLQHNHSIHSPHVLKKKTHFWITTPYTWPNQASHVHTDRQTRQNVCPKTHNHNYHAL
jgi:hypothetical protein